MGDKCGRQVEDKCKLMRPKAPRVGDKCGDICVGDKCKLIAAQGTQSGRQVWKTSVGDKCKLMRPKAPRVRDKCGKQVWETSGRQV